jgi:hypothetical protein
MTERTPSRHLLEWALAAFHNGFFFAAALALLYRAGGLGVLLGSLNTLIGLGAFVVVWGLTWWTTRRAFAGVDWLALEQPRQFIPMLGRGLIWGGVNGVLFFLAAFLITVVSEIVLALLQGTGQAIPIGLLVAGLVGLVVAFAFGAAIGLILAGLDLLIVLLAWRLTRGTVEPIGDGPKPAPSQPPG